jgi:putative SOS response-associated peptidase YedK
VDRGNYDCWLSAADESLLAPCPPELLELYPVGPVVNNARNETPDCIEPVA